MKALAELFISAVELLEAEGRELRSWTTRMGVAFTLLLVAGLLGAVGLVMLAGAVFLVLHRELGVAAWMALAIVGVLVIAGAGLLIWKANKTLQ